MDFDAAFTVLLGFEGGYSDDAADPGGKTRFGVTEAEARKHGYTGDMTALPMDFAKSVYRQNYWDKCRCDELPADIRYDVFDAAVNSGPQQAVRWLQGAVGVAADGIIGGQTMAAVAACNAPTVKARMNGMRLAFMTNLQTLAGVRQRLGTAGGKHPRHAQLNGSLAVTVSKFPANAQQFVIDVNPAPYSFVRFGNNDRLHKQPAVQLVKNAHGASS
jgi:lysozyme family protein